MQQIRFAGLGGAILALSVGIAQGQTTEDFFNDRIVHEIRLDVRPSDYATLKQNYLLNTFYPADFRWKFNGQDVVMRNIGIRSRGRGSRSPDKPNLRLDFNRYEENQRFIGLSSAVLKSNNQDGSMLREQTIMKLWSRTGLPASREAYCRLYVNDQYQGMYLLVEEVRNAYIERYLGERDGDLYKFDPVTEGYRFEWSPTCATSTQVACSTDTAKWTEAPFNPEENRATYDITPTINLIRMTNTVSDADFERTISPMIDFRYMAAYLAMENYSTDWDSFLGHGLGMNNFFIYRYKGTNFHQIFPWDKDASYDWAERPIFYEADRNVLIRRILALPTYRARLLESAYIVALLAGGPGGWLEWEHQREYELGRPSIYEDTLKQYSEGGILYSSSNEIFEREVAENRDWLRLRTEFVLSEVSANGWTPSSAISINAGGVVDTASYVANAAPGAYMSIFGSGFSQTTETAASAPFPTTLAGVSVVVNGFFAPIHYVSPDQINVQVPWELGIGNGTTRFTVLVNGTPIKGARAGSPINATPSNSIVTPVSPYSPGVFAVTHGDGTFLTSRAASAGDVLTIYANGLGPLQEAIGSGAVAPAERLVYTRDTPSVTIGGVPAEVQFSGLAPGFVGTYQVNVKTPAGIAVGTAPVRITMGAQTSSSFNIATR